MRRQCFMNHGRNMVSIIVMLSDPIPVTGSMGILQLSMTSTQIVLRGSNSVIPSLMACTTFSLDIASKTPSVATTKKSILSSISTVLMSGTAETICWCAFLSFLNT